MTNPQSHSQRTLKVLAHNNHYIWEMATHQQKYNMDVFYFVTFTCYKWMPLIEITDLYSYFIGWSEKLSDRGVKICGYVFMPNHIHLLVFIDKDCKNINKTIGDSKAFYGLRNS